MNGDQRMPDVELHSKACLCGGTGWLSYPGIGAHAHRCESKDVVVISPEEWVRLGKPALKEDVEAARFLCGKAES